MKCSHCNLLPYCQCKICTKQIERGDPCDRCKTYYEKLETDW